MNPRANLYAPPEVRSGHRYTAESDVYSLGVLLYQIVVGDFDRRLRKGWAREIEDETLRSDIAECVEAEPDRRLATATELTSRLRDLDNRRRAHEEAHADGDGDRESERMHRVSSFIKLRCGESSGVEGKVMTLTGLRFTFGRERVSVKVPGGVVSRQHAELKLSRRGWVLRDLSSRNGTFLNGQRIVSVRIRVGDTVVLGTSGAHYTVIALEGAL